MCRLLLGVTVVALFGARALAEQYLVTLHVVELSWKVERGEGTHEEFQKRLEEFAKQNEPKVNVVGTIETLANLDAPFHARVHQDNRTLDMGGCVLRTQQGMRLKIRSRIAEWHELGQVKLPARRSVSTWIDWDESKIGVACDADLRNEEPLELDKYFAAPPETDRRGDSFYHWSGDYFTLGGLTQVKSHAPPTKGSLLSKQPPATAERTTTTIMVRLRRFVPGPSQ